MSATTQQSVTPDARGRYGPFGGRYVPETLVAPLEELESAYAAARAAPKFRAELDGLLRAKFSSLRTAQLPESESSNVIRQYLNAEIQRFQSINQIVPHAVTPSELSIPPYFPIKTLADRMGPPTPAAGEGGIIFQRNAQPKGPLTVFGYDYFEAAWAKLGNATKPELLAYEGLWGGGEEYAYEVLNFADGKRNAQQIRDAVSAEYGPVPLKMVVEYLKALQEIAAVEQVKVPVGEPNR